MFFDPRCSTKGALLTAHRQAKRETDLGDCLAVGEIINPNALPMYQVWLFRVYRTILVLYIFEVILVYVYLFIIIKLNICKFSLCTSRFLFLE